MSDSKNPEHSREVAKLCFEFFKHFTTLATAVTLVELALFDQLRLNTVVAVLSVICSALAVMVAIAGMLFVSVRAAVEGVFLGEQDKVFTLMLLTSLMLILSIVAFVAGAAYSYGGLVALLVVNVVLAVIGFSIGGYLRLVLFKHR